MGNWVKENSVLELDVFTGLTPGGRQVADSSERSDLPEDAKRRWDYFYRPDENLYYDLMTDKYISKASRKLSKHKKEIHSLKTEVERTRRQISNTEKSLSSLLIRIALTAAVSVVLVAYGVMAQMLLGFLVIGVIVFLAASGVFSYFGKKELIKRGENDLIESMSAIQDLAAKIAKLETQVSEATDEVAELFESYPPPPSDQRMRESLESRLEELQEHALLDCGLKKNDIALAGGPIVLSEWGYVQSSKLPGYSSTPEGRLHLVAMSNDGLLEFCVHYVQFIFVADDRIEVYGTFLDRISGQNYGMLSNTFLYRHITNVRIASAAEKSGFLSTVDGADVLTFELRVASGDGISVALTDETLQNEIGKTIGVEIEPDATRVSLARSAVADIKKQLLDKQNN